MAGGIFISYRRDDSRHAAGRLYQHFVQSFPRDQLFMDIDNIEPGLDFVRVVTDTVANCDALVAVIGPGWLDTRDETGARRLDNPDDFVRLEIEAALARNVRVIPVLVDGADMPRAAELPEPMRPLVRRNAVRLAHERFGTEAESLVTTLTKIVVPSPKTRGGNASAQDKQPPSAVLQQSQSGLSRLPFWAALALWIAALGGLSFGFGMLWQESGLPHVWGAVAGSTGASLAASVLLISGAIWFGRNLSSRSAADRALFAIAIVAGLAIIVTWFIIK